jgi:flagellar assembly protein FliH
VSRVIRGAGAEVVSVVVQEAREEATRIVEEAHREAARIREEQERMLREKARWEARAELAAEHLALEQARRATVEASESALTSLALALAERLLADRLEADPTRVRAIVREALDRVRRASRVRVRVHPADRAALGDLDAEVLEDPSIERGGCVVESELGEVDARLEVRLEALARALAEAR